MVYFFSIFLVYKLLLLFDGISGDIGWWSCGSCVKLKKRMCIFMKPLQTGNLNRFISAINLLPIRYRVISICFMHLIFTLSHWIIFTLNWCLCRTNGSYVKSKLTCYFLLTSTLLIGKIAFLFLSLIKITKSFYFQFFIVSIVTLCWCVRAHTSAFCEFFLI